MKNKRKLVGKRKDERVGDQVKIQNAGLILCWPFLPVFFKELNLVIDNRIESENLSKAVYLLQYLAYGKIDFPESQLVLNKLLVGMKSDHPLEETVLSKSEMDQAEGLLVGMKSYWTNINNASLEAVQETFLQREGVLEFGEDSNRLSIAKTGVDVLLDSLPWSIGIIRLPWMDNSLEVNW